MFGLIEIQVNTFIHTWVYTSISLVATKPHSNQILVSQNVFQQEKPGKMIDPGAGKIQDECGVP